MKIAVEGCCHGELDHTYAELQRIEKETNQKADALIICGDFQAIRNQADLLCMAVPPKYRQLGQFHKYYTGEKTAPVLTLVVGGNHEASNYMWELYHGGWLAPNIYYLGGSNCVRLNGVRIAGFSGIYNSHHYHLGHFERIPYDNSTLRSVYHVRAHDVCKLSLLTPDVGICISHDWPEGIYEHGDVKKLIAQKPFFKADIQKHELGNPYGMELLKSLKPQWWLSAHLHVRFAAEVDHTGAGVTGWATPSKLGHSSKSAGQGRRQLNNDEIIMDEDDQGMEQGTSAQTKSTNTDEIVMDDEDEPTPVGPADEPSSTSDLKQPAVSPSSPNALTTTKFLALDKCVPKRKFLEIIDVPTPDSSSSDTPPKLTFDSEWLAISRAMHPLLSLDRRSAVQPRLSLAKGWVERELEWVQDMLSQRLKLTHSDNGSPSASAAVPSSLSPASRGPLHLEIMSVQQFVMTAPGPGKDVNPRQQPQWYTNPQTEAFCTLIGVDNKVNPPPTASNNRR